MLSYELRSPIALSTPSPAFLITSTVFFLHSVTAIAGESSSLLSRNTSSLPSSFIRFSASATSDFENGKSTNVVNTLKAVWKQAIANGVITSSKTCRRSTHSQKRYMISPIAVPIILKLIWITDTLLAFLLTPNEEISAVTQVPIFWPMLIGIATPYVICPVKLSACSTPTEAADDWITPVNIVPISTPKNGFLNAVSILVNSGISASGDNASDIHSMPCIKTAKPTSTNPTSLCFCFLPPIIRSTPISAIMGEKYSGFIISKNGLSVFTPLRLNSHAVSVVPILDPMMIPTV